MKYTLSPHYGCLGTQYVKGKYLMNSPFKVEYELAPAYSEDEDTAALVWVGDRPTYRGSIRNCKPAFITVRQETLKRNRMIRLPDNPVYLDKSKKSKIKIYGISPESYLKSDLFWDNV